MRRSRNSSSAPWLLAEIGAASAETIAHRMVLMSTGQCTPAEYSKMITEKIAAAQSSWMKMAFSPWDSWPSWTSMLMPYHTAARRNARRLRGKS